MAATTVDTLLVRIEADMSSLRRQLSQSQAASSRATSKMKGHFNSMQSSMTAVTAKLTKFRGGIVAVASVIAAGLGIGIANVNARFQDLELTLETVFGGMQQGQDAMKFISVFAQRTPFDIETLSKAFIQLGGAGIAPTEKLLTTFGDAASATTNRVAAFEAMVRIATRSVGGGLGLEELEQLVSQGIPVYSILADEIGVTRSEISELGQTAQGAAKIMAGLQAGLDKRFGGGMERASKNLSVSMSNLGIAANELVLSLGAGIGGFGLTSAFTFLSDTLTQVAVILKPVAHLLGTVLAAAVFAVTAPLRGLTEVILFLGRQMADLAEFAAGFLPDSFVGLKEAVASLRGNLDELSASMNSNLKIAEVSTAKTKEQLKAEQKITDLLANKRFAVQQLEDQILGASEADILYAEAKRGLTGATAKQLEQLRQSIEAELEYTKLIADNTAADEKKAEQLAKQSSLIATMQKDNEILNLQTLNLTEAELAYHEALIQIGEVTPENAKKIKILAQEQAALNSKITKAEKEQEDYNKKMEEGQDIVKGYIPAQQELEAQLEKVRFAMRGAAEDDIPLYEKAIQDLQHQIKMTNPAFESLFNAAMQAADGISNALADAFVNGKLSLQSLGDIFKQVVKQMIADAIKAQIVKFLMGSIFGAAGGGSVSSFGGSGNASQANSTLSHAGGGAISRYGRAGGGMAMPTLVGERGPELFVPHTAGVVRNNHDTKNMMGGGSPVVVNQNINIETGVAQTVRAEVMSMMPRIKSETIQAMIDGKRRGNSISKAFA